MTLCVFVCLCVLKVFTDCLRIVHVYVADFLMKLVDIISLGTVTPSSTMLLVLRHLLNRLGIRRHVSHLHRFRIVPHLVRLLSVFSNDQNICVVTLRILLMIKHKTSGRLQHLTNVNTLGFDKIADTLQSLYSTNQYMLSSLQCLRAAIV